MKSSNIVFLVLLNFSAICAMAQAKKTDKPIINLNVGEYRFSKIFKEYEGEWAIKNDSIFFKMSLSVKRKVPSKSGNGYIYYDILEGHYLYIKNGDTVVNTFKSPVQHLHRAPLVTLDDQLPLSLKFKDVVYNRVGIVTLTKVDRNTVKWSLIEPKFQFTLKGYGIGFSVPQNLSLKRNK